jgi:hypothetical protein
VVFDVIPCSAGVAPVTIVVWLGYVIVGNTPTTPVAYAPSLTKLLSSGISRPCRSASVT